MQTVSETRKQRLRILKTDYKHWGDINEKLGWDRTDPRLSQIQSGNLRSDRGTPYVMGDPTARLIEEKLGLPAGWMDTPPTYAELYGQQDPRAKVQLLMESLPPDQWNIAVRLLSALAQPADKNGTGP